MRLIGIVAVVWLLVGVLAPYQRGYFGNTAASCATSGSVDLTVLAGPLNYAGVNPKVEACNLPQPSQ